jgi:predicted phosphodiesterase
MTRWGILSDIHGNLPALERALAGLRERGVERIAVLGDNLGRGDSAGCIRLIHEIADLSVVGNRDLDWQDRVNAESKAYVLGLPRIGLADGIAFSHGDARLTRDLSTGDISSGFARARTWLPAHDCCVWIFGHSHRARIWSIRADTDMTGVRSLALLFDAASSLIPATIRLPGHAEPGHFWAINAGSVGLPFPGKGPASALVYDAEAGCVEIFAV